MADTAKKTAAPVAKKATAPKVELDFAAMDVQDVEDASDLKHERGSKYDNSPVKEWLSESYKTDKPKQIPVPSKAHAEALEIALRSVAARLKIGVRIVTKPADAKRPDGAQVVKFLGKEKRNYDAEKAKANREAKKATEAAKATA